MKDKPFVSIITVNYNGFSDTCELIASLQTHIESVSYEIIVVDNASINNEALSLKEIFPGIIAIRSETNLGFAGGNNLGIKKATGNYLFFINNDTYIEEDKIGVLIQRLESQENIGGVSPKIKDAFPPQKIQFAGFTPLSRISLRNKTIGQGDYDKEEYNKPASTPYLHGAAMCFKRSAIEKVGLMPEVYFLYYEELDWCAKFTSKNYELWYEPDCTIFHKEGQSTGKVSTMRTFYMTRNRLLYAWRNLYGTRKWAAILYLTFIVTLKNTMIFTMKGEFKYITSVFKGIFDFINLPDKMQ